MTRRARRAASSCDETGPSSLTPRGSGPAMRLDRDEQLGVPNLFRHPLEGRQKDLAPLRSNSYPT